MVTYEHTYVVAHTSFTYGTCDSIRSFISSPKFPCYFENLQSITFRVCERFQTSLLFTELPCYLQSFRLTTFKAYDHLRTYVLLQGFLVTSKASLLPRKFPCYLESFLVTSRASLLRSEPSTNHTQSLRPPSELATAFKAHCRLQNFLVSSRAFDLLLLEFTTAFRAHYHLQTFPLPPELATSPDLHTYTTFSRPLNRL